MNHLGIYSSYNSCTGVSLSSHRLSSLKAVVRNKFLTTANSHRLHSLLLLLWTKWFFRPACIKKLGGAWYSELLIFASLDKVFSNFVSGKRKRIYECFVRGEKEWCATEWSEARGGTWDSIIAVIGDGAKSELAGVRENFLTPALSFRGERLWLEPVAYYSYYEDIPCPKGELFYSLKETDELYMLCVHSGGDIMYTRTGDCFGKTKFHSTWF